MAVKIFGRSHRAFSRGLQAADSACAVSAANQQFTAFDSYFAWR
jgi:hypothetical protein